MRLSKVTKITGFILFIIILGCVFLVLNPHLPSKLIFSYREDYTELKLEDVDVLLNKNVAVDVNEVEDSLNKVTDRASLLFDVINPEKVDLFVSLPENRIYNLYLGGNNLGIYNPTVKAIAVDGQFTGDLVPTIAHEYSHHLFWEYINALGIEPTEIPKWLDEGVALTFEYELMDHVLVKYGPMFTVLPFPQLETEQGVNSNTIYIQGFYGTMYLIEKYGNHILKDLMEQTAKTSFQEAWTRLIDEPYDTFHHNFEINRSYIREATNLQGNHEGFIQYAEALNEEHGKLNVYTPFVSLALIDAYIATDQLDKAKDVFEMYEPFINNPAEYVDLAKYFNVDSSYSESLLEKGLIYATKYGYDLDEYERYQNAEEY